MASEERMRILEMVREGKITAEEAARLLEALKPATGGPQAPRERPERHEDPIGRFIETIVEAATDSFTGQGWRGFGGAWARSWSGGRLAGLERRREREAEGWQFLRFSDGSRGTFELPPGARLIVESEAGSVEAEATDGPARLDLEENGAFNFDVYAARKEQEVVIAAHRTAHEARLPRLKVSVPRHAAHVELRTAGGGVKVRGFACPLSLKTSGGGIQVEGQGEGTVHARTAGGGIDVEGRPGAVRLHTAGGSIRFKGRTESLDAKTAGGSITIDGVRLVSGEHSAKTAGGSVRVRLAADSSVEIDARTQAGSINVDLPGAQGQYSGSRISPRYHGRFNGSGAHLDVHTVGGSITVGLAEGEAARTWVSSPEPPAPSSSPSAEPPAPPASPSPEAGEAAGG